VEKPGEREVILEGTEVVVRTHVQVREDHGPAL
jgi:hypothetical protein